MKRKLYFWVKKYINSDNIKFVLMMIPLMLILVQQVIQGEFDWTTFFDIGILVTFMFLVASELFAKWIQKKVAQNAEDQAKLIDDYEKLVKKYSCMNLVEYHGVTFPEECLYMRCAGERIEIEDSPEKYYNLPSQVANNSKELMEAHSASTVYNQINIRLDGLEKDKEKNCIVLKTSRTQYFDSLITNRSCDYIFGDREVTIRELYEPGPILKPLHLSKLSNHLGFNGFIITKDGKIPFIFRKKNLSIAKSHWSTSIGASLKTKYVLSYTNNYTMDEESLGRAIIGEIRDELKIGELENEKGRTKTDNALTVEKANESIFAFYRDLVEGGKPQFLFCLQLENITAADIKEKIEEKTDKNDVTTDGDKVHFFTIEELKMAELDLDKMIVNGQEYKMMPSSVVSVVLLLEFLEKKEF